ncbi:RHS repeat-associated core domain-containing protein [Chryseobacterium sp. C39-AII1]|uniref:RHS repeat-associated core domain-containing protein n=1 Tax=Chryseobacterium sp. C39-AII1 TaxID=3080332 RepID=UPI00320B9F5E
MELAKNAASEPNVYYLHGDHLGTANFVTEQHGKATQFFLNLPFGETMAEQMIGIYDNPYKFNAKELDSETGLYYYGARYYNPRLSIWYGVDPLAVYNPVMETQFYGDGQHNGGVYFWGNLNPYIYTYQNPVKYIDPNGKQVDAVKKYLGNLWSDWSPWSRAVERKSGESESSQKRRLGESTIRNINGIARSSATSEVGHAVLDVGGLLPVIGEPLDGANAIWYAAEGDYLNSGLSAVAMVPIAGYAATGTKITIKSLVKTDSKILKFAKETFQGNELLSKEATGLIEQAMGGNLKAGRGAKDIGNGIFELRGHNQGARIYYRMNEGIMEILGYSNKGNQQKVIDVIKKKYGSK